MVFTTEFWNKRRKELKEKMSNNHWSKFKNKDKISKIISKKHKGKHHSPKTEFKKGQKAWNKGLTKETDDSVKKISETRKKLILNKKLKINPNKFIDGHKQFNTGKTHFKKGENMGKQHHNWRGGISFEPYSTDWTQILKLSIRQRDNFQCQVCQKLQGKRKLDVHHIDYNKKNCNPENLVTLCITCHRKTNTNRKKWMRFFNAF